MLSAQFGAVHTASRAVFPSGDPLRNVLVNLCPYKPHTARSRFGVPSTQCCSPAKASHNPSQATTEGFLTMGGWKILAQFSEASYLAYNRANPEWFTPWEPCLNGCPQNESLCIKKRSSNQLQLCAEQADCFNSVRRTPPAAPCAKYSFYCIM